MRSQLPTIAITIGDPAGVGPEVALRACAQPAVHRWCRPVVIGSTALLQRVADALHLPMPAVIEEPALHDFAPAAVVPGRVDARCGRAGVAWVEAAIAGCLDGRYAAMVTCPLNKAAMHAAKVPYPGHTELLAARCRVGNEAMMMYHRRLAVVLATCHQGLASVPSSLTTQRIVSVACQFAAALTLLRRRAPRLGICGLNPHAGEDGLFGPEDAAIVAPAIAQLRERGIAAEGPLPPDTAFTPDNRKRYHGHVCLYHDQGLIPFKALAFDQGVNVTLGLPIVRTSVDHGTAFDIAWRGSARHGNLLSAIQLAAKLVALRTG